MEIKESFKEYFQELYKDYYEEIEKTIFLYHKPAIRVNTLLTTSEFVYKSLTRKGFKLRAIPWIKDAFFVDEKPYAIGSTIEHTLGYYYVQDASSMIPALVLSPQLHELILDASAAPGSKTTQIGILMQNTGAIVANDLDASRLNILAMNVQRMALKNVVINKGDATKFNFMEKFDKILVDAPCTASGTIRIDEPSPMKQWSKKAAVKISRVQLKMLNHLWNFFKEDGILVYSTCSLSIHENELVIDKFLKMHDDAILEPININIPTRIKPFLSYKDKPLNESIANSLKILPSEDYEGFFIAKIRKINKT